MGAIEDPERREAIKKGIARHERKRKLWIRKNELYHETLEIDRQLTLLMLDQGETHKAIAEELSIPVYRVSQWKKEADNI